MVKDIDQKDRVESSVGKGQTGSIETDDLDQRKDTSRRKTSRSRTGLLAMVMGNHPFRAGL